MNDDHLFNAAIYPVQKFTDIASGLVPGHLVDVDLYFLVCDVPYHPAHLLYVLF